MSNRRFNILAALAILFFVALFVLVLTVRYPQ